LVKKHPELVKFEAKIDMSDLENDPILRFQSKYIIELAVLLVLFIPTMIVWKLFGETLFLAFIQNFSRQTVMLHTTFLINSAAHMFGMKPFDK
jgi:stearoyl-CoA desaturase (Delta-9 desaturase)